jgi:hypothetical protein
MRGVSGVRSRRVRQDDRTRERIRAAYLINRLQGHVAGTVELSATQIRAAEILLRKCLPDLLAAQFVDQTVHRFVEVPRTLSKEEWLETRGQGYAALENKSLCRDAMHDGNIVDLKVADEKPDDGGKLN